jgi:excisionase family DNA binding protein
MSFRTLVETPSDVCGTSYAAKVLGLSVATVQALVERGELEGWRTKGGHRRITLTSLLAYQARNPRKSNVAGPDASSAFLRVLVVDDDLVTLDLIRAAVESWNLPIDCTCMASAMEAMMDMTSIRPEVLVSDLQMPGVDGFEFLRTVRANPAFASTLTLVMTVLSDEEIAARGGLPRHTHVLHKPVNTVWLNGFLAALVRTKEIVHRR